ncbi:MAG TPA: DNA photolyase family protein [Corynebacterium pollutisoli]|nr:DNA photolyase family protein [Corynebacterium pollutisoli]
MSSALLWLRDDLRIQDNAALELAREHGPVTAVFILEDPATTGVRPLGGAASWWLHHSLLRLAEQLAERGIPLHILSGDPAELIPDVARRVNAGLVTWNRRYHQPQRDNDAALKHLLNQHGLEVHSTPGHLLVEPWLVTTSQGRPYQVFTPFSRAVRAKVEEEALPLGRPGPPETMGPGADLGSTLHELQGLALLPSHPSRREPVWTAGLEDAWTPGEEAAWRRLEDFVGKLGDPGHSGYATGRDLPGEDLTSRLSPHLRFGEISPHAVWAAVSQAGGAAEDIVAFQSELMWRDFAWHRLYHRPDLATRNVKANFDRFPWAWDPPEASACTAEGRDGRRIPGAGPHHLALSAWRSGTTGFPLVDAGMRELWATGHMHNRVRMVVGSFLTKNLGIHWRHGEEWFWDTLVDADPASNAFNWQWVAGSGDDASPYFRIFNPVTQQKRFDPGGVYVRRWAPDSELHPPVVDLRESRAAALAAYESIKLGE